MDERTHDASLDREDFAAIRRHRTHRNHSSPLPGLVSSPQNGDRERSNQQTWSGGHHNPSRMHGFDSTRRRRL